MSESRGNQFALSRSNPFFLLFFLGGKGGVGSAHAKRGFGEERAVQSAAALAAAERGARPSPRFYRNPF